MKAVKEDIEDFVVDYEDGKVVFKWDCKVTGPYEIRLFNKSMGKWKYFKTITDNSYAIKLRKFKDGDYRVKVGCRESEHWSSIKKFIIKDSRFIQATNLADMPLSELQRENIESLNEEIKQQKVALDSYPISMSVILEGRGCNVSCVYCTHWWGDKARGYTYGTPKHLIADLKEFMPYLRSLAIGGGEPLMYREWYDILDMASDYESLQMSLTTNGMGLTARTIKRICDLNFTWLRFSVDAATPETFSRIRVNGRLSKLLRVSENIREYRKGLFPKIQWNFVIMDWNFREMVAFVELAHKYGVECINFKMLIPSQIANSKFTQMQDFMPQVLKPDKTTVDLFQLDISRDVEKSLELLTILNEAKERARKYGIQLLDMQIMPYIEKNQPDFAGDSTSDGDIDFDVPDYFSKSNQDLIQHCISVEKDIPMVKFPRTKTEFCSSSQVLYLDEIVEKHFPDYLNLVRDREVLSLMEVLEAVCSSGRVGRNEITCVATETASLQHILTDPDFDRIFPDFFCTLPFTSLSWGDYRFQACCYAQPFFTYSNFQESVKSLRDLWNSEALQKMRQIMYQGKINHSCKKTCPHYTKGGVKTYLEVSEES